ncbi:unnamed protein product [Periconia digitata]|uniref:2EXR domain-containing protein n=1 Tax=Periconia digitata TaxID=1303443 RepID=A0A9W4UT22_9PLEO|nr:unnamed protein product [Periconia digitata]
MADSTSIRRSKRKRPTVDYREQDLSENENTQDPQDAEDGPPHKKPQVKKPAKPLPKRKIFPFLQLPAEIRNQIYKLCLHDPVGVYLCPTTYAFRRTVNRVAEARYRAPHRTGGDDDPEKPAETFETLVPALLATNKQIYREGRQILYGNDFYMGDTLTMHSFLVDIGARAASLLKFVTLIHWAEGRGVNKAYNHAAFGALSAATNLERFNMVSHTSYRTHPKPVAIQFYRDAFPWLEAVGIAKGKADAAVHLVTISAGNFNHFSRRNGWIFGKKNGTYEDIDSFRNELAKLLNARMNMIRS